MHRIEEAISNAQRFRKYNALITETFELARKQAKDSLARGVQPFPVVVKDCFLTKNVRTSCASAMLCKYRSPYSATVVVRLIQNGGCIIGKANMDEYCMGTSSTQSFFGPVKNGFSDEACIENDWLIPGGSSGGSAVAVQLGMADIGLGSDTGGSTRNPAAFTGNFGLKPSYGILSRHGLIPLVNSLDSPSIVAKSASDCNHFLKIMCGRDSNDSTSVDAVASCFMEKRPLSGITVGIPREYFNKLLSRECWELWNEAAKALAHLGCKIKEVRMPHTEFSIICYHVLAEADISSNMARYDGVAYGHRPRNLQWTHSMYAASRSESLNEVVRRRIFAGNYFLMKNHYNEYFGKALKVRRLIKGDFDRVFREENCSVLLTPVTSGTPPQFSEIKEEEYERERCEDFYTQPANMAGVPACSVPLAVAENGRPVALQILADHLCDGIALDTAHVLHNFFSG